MANTGYGAYKILEEVDLTTGKPTGKEKFNLFGDPDYVPPHLADTCRLIVIEEPSRNVVLSLSLEGQSTSDIEINRVLVVVNAYVNIPFTEETNIFGRIQYEVDNAPSVGSTWIITFKPGVQFSTYRDPSSIIEYNAGSTLQRVITITDDKEYLISKKIFITESTASGEESET